MSTGCFKLAAPPPLTLNQTPESNCQGIKIAGTLSTADFENIFSCLNQKGALEPLKAVVMGHPQNTALFVDLYNQTFGTDPALRNRSLMIFQQLDQNQGLDDLLNFSSALITEFIDSTDFRDHFLPLLQTILTDEWDLLSILKSIVLHPQADLLAKLMKESIQTQTLGQMLESVGTLLRQKDGDGNTGAQNLTHVLKTVFGTAATSTAFTLEDAYQLNLHKVPQGMLETLYRLKHNHTLPVLTRLISDLATHQTTSILTEERLGKLKHDPDSLTQDERDASEEFLSRHPKNDLVALIKLVASLHRGFLEDEHPTRRQNLLDSLDYFLRGVKAVFDGNDKLGPDAAATRRMTIYSLYSNISYLEIMFEPFHLLPLEERIALYKTEGNPYSNLYAHYIVNYKDQKFTEDQRITRKRLKDEGWGPRDIPRKLLERKEEFYRDIFPRLAEAYLTFLDQEIRNTFEAINHTKIFMDSTIYTFLMSMKEVKSLSVFFQKLLINLDNPELDPFIREFITVRVRPFFKDHRPIDLFMRSLDKELSGATWLAHTVYPQIHGWENAVPMKDQITLIAMVEAGQVLERLLQSDTFIDDLRTAVVPFIKVISGAEQEGRVMQLFQFLHNGHFSNEETEAGQLANQLSPLLLQAIETGFLNHLLDLLASLGEKPETINHFLTFLTESRPKHDFLKRVHQVREEAEQNIFKQIEFETLRSTKPEEVTSVIDLLGTLKSPQKEALIKFARHELLTQNPERLITPAVETLKGLILNHEISLTHLFAHTGLFLTPTHVTQLTAFIRHYSDIQIDSSSESFLTQLIKEDQMSELLRLFQRMLEDGNFGSTHLFIRELIDTGELKRALRLLSTLLLSYG